MIRRFRLHRYRLHDPSNHQKQTVVHFFLKICGPSRRQPLAGKLSRSPGQSAFPWLNAAIDEYKKHGGDSVAQWFFGVNDSDGFGMSRKFQNFAELQNMWKVKNGVK